MVGLDVGNFGVRKSRAWWWVGFVVFWFDVGIGVYSRDRYSVVFLERIFGIFCSEWLWLVYFGESRMF